MKLKLNLNVVQSIEGETRPQIPKSVDRQAVFDAHPANFYYHAIELYQITACVFSNEIYIKQCRFASL